MLPNHRLAPQRKASLAVILVSAIGEDMMINWWNWRPIVAMLVRAGILPAGEREERCLANGCGGCLSEAESLHAAEYVESFVAGMKPGQRVLFNGEVTAKPIDYTKPVSEWDQADTWNNYSAQYDLLKNFAAFCRRSRGFEVL